MFERAGIAVRPPKCTIMRKKRTMKKCITFDRTLDLSTLSTMLSPKQSTIPLKSMFYRKTALLIISFTIHTHLCAAHQVCTIIRLPYLMFGFCRCAPLHRIRMYICFTVYAVPAMGYMAPKYRVESR